MSALIGDLNTNSIRFGSDVVTKVYVGEDLVFNLYDYASQYLALVPTTTAATFKFSGNTVSYSLDSGSTWTSLPSDTSTPSVGVGDKIMFKANLSQNSGSIGIFSSSSEFDADGNIMSLLYEDNFIGQTSMGSSTFIGLFSGSTVVNAKNLVLPATELSDYCYQNMFNGCSSLVTAPKLPSTTLSQFCYSQMFQGCTSLTVAPKLPATTLTYCCYYGMFDGCTSLTTAPKLPSTTLADFCYRDMFYGCTSLTVAPKLLATTLAQYCYYGMFRGCTSLTEAPQLPATT